MRLPQEKIKAKHGFPLRNFVEGGVSGFDGRNLPVAVKT